MRQPGRKENIGNHGQLREHHILPEASHGKVRKYRDDLRVHLLTDCQKGSDGVFLVVDVRVYEEKEITACRCRGLVQRPGFAEPSFRSGSACDETYSRVLTRQQAHDFARAVAGLIVNDDDLEPLVRLVHESTNRIFNRNPLITGGNEDRKEWNGGGLITRTKPSNRPEVEEGLRDHQRPEQKDCRGQKT